MNRTPRAARRWRSRPNRGTTPPEEADALEPDTAEPSGGGEPFTAPETPSERAEDEPKDEEEQDGVGSFLFEAEAEGYDADETAAETGSGGYVDLPGDEPEVAELIEETVVVEEAPDIEAVEAAADHFAESVRDEVQVEPEAPVPQPTEEVAIAQLLGEEGATDDAETTRTVRVGAEGFGGPSWQEPTAIEVGADSERAGPGRDVPTAFITGIVLAGLAVGALLIGPGAFAIFAGVVVLFAQGEFYLAMQKRHYQPATALGLVSGALVLGAGYYRGENAMLAIMALSLFATFLWYMTVPPPHRRNVVANIAITTLGVAYIPLLAAYALAVLKLPDGEGLTLSIIGLTFVYDTAAFGVGYFWGSRPLAPNISPKKSWEGAIGATLVVIAVAVGVVGSSVDAARHDRAFGGAGGRGRVVRAARRPRRVAAQARPGDQGHGRDPARSRRRDGPDRLGAVRGPRRVHLPPPDPALRPLSPGVSRPSVVCGRRGVSLGRCARS